MRRPVRIVRQPKAQSGFEIKMNPGMGFNANQLSWPVMAGEFSAPETEVNNTLKPTDWDHANLEAEKGETVVTNLNHDGIPEHYTIGGKRHYEGGTPLNLPPNSFIFSRDRSMKIKDEEILKMFGMSPNKKGYTPADIAKQYDINKFRKTLADPDSEDLQRETAEMMITNYNLKLGKLALVQESLKGFPQGIPMISTPYLQTMNINPEEFTQTQGQPDQTGEEDVARYGKQVRRNLPKHQTTGMVDADKNGISDFIQAPGLNTTGGGSGSMTIKRKGPGLAGLFKNPQKAMEVGMAGAGVLTNIANAPERQAAQAVIDDKMVSDQLYDSVGMNLGWNVKDNYAGLQYDPTKTGAQGASGLTYGNLPGQNIATGKYGTQIRGTLPRADKGWIKQILDFESKKGSASGTGLPNYGIKKDVWASKYPEMWKDNTITEEEAIDFIEKEYMPMVKDYPEEAQKRLVDYAYNTGRDIRDVIMLASGVQNLDNVQTKNTDEKLWSANQDKIKAAMKDPNYISKIDEAKRNIYEDTWKRKGDSDAYTKTSLPRVKMWDESSNNASQTNNSNAGGFDTKAAAQSLKENFNLPDETPFQKPASYEDYQSKTGYARSGMSDEEKAYEQEYLNNYKYPNQGGNLGNFKMFGNIGGSGFFGPRSRMVGMRYNQDKGIYEAVNRKGEVIGFFNAGQAQGQGGYGSTGATTYGTSGTMDGTETTTTTKRKVKKQVIPDDAITEGRVIDRSKYDTEEDYIKARDEAFANAGGKKKVYTKAADGKYYTVGESDYFDKGDVEGRLKYLGEKFKDPKVAALLKEKMKAAAADPKKLKYSGLTAADIDNMKPEELADEFLNFNKRNLSVSKLLQEQGGDYGCYNQSGAYDGGAYTKSKTGKQPKCNPDMGKKYSKLEKLYEAVGMPMDYKNNKKGAALQQLSYIGYQDLLDDRDNNKIADKDVVDKLKNFQIKQLGVADENIGTGKAQISPADSYYTNTTAGEVAGINERKRKEDLLADTEVEEDVVTKEKKKGALDYARKTGRAPWFIQDIVKSGKTFADWANINKEMPWMPMPDVTLPEAVYYDPNRQLAANSEASANILQNLAAFQGAQGLSSRASQIFGQTAKGAADILAQYNNQNVGVANNMELQRANILNQNAIRRTGLAKQLYDENAVANQQYRNAKNQAMDNIVNQWVSGKTNAVNAYNLNQMFPQYNTHPESGGMISFEGGRPITADTSGKGSFLNKYKEYRGVLPAGTDDNVIWNLVKNDLGTSDNNEVDPDYLKAMAATMQGVGSSKKANRYGYNNS